MAAPVGRTDITVAAHPVCVRGPLADGLFKKSLDRSDSEFQSRPRGIWLGPSCNFLEFFAGFMMLGSLFKKSLDRSV